VPVASTLYTDDLMVFSDRRLTGADLGRSLVVVKVIRLLQLIPGAGIVA
jgi:hypothetical protein